MSTVNRARATAVRSRPQFGGIQVLAIGDATRTACESTWLAIPDFLPEPASSSSQTGRHDLCEGSVARASIIRSLGPFCVWRLVWGILTGA
jgi:hypothetical protein